MKVRLLSSAMVPKGDGTRAVLEAHRGETVDVPDAMAERFIRLGVAEKAAGRGKTADDKS